MFEAVIFDMDGLMFNTEVMFIDEFREKLKELEIDAPLEVIQSMIGCDSRKIAQYETKYPGINEAMKQLQNERVDYFFRYFPEKGSGDKPGLSQLIAYLKEKNIPYAIASSSATEHIKRFIGHAQCIIEPSVIVSSKEEGIPSKPAPDIFLIAAEKLGVPKDKCLVLEDGKYGILAAKQAGIPSVFIQDQVKPDEEMKQAIVYSCQDLEEVIDLMES